MADQALESCIRRLKSIIIFGGDLVSAEVKPQLERPKIESAVRSMDWTEGDVGGACPSYERALAAHAAWKLNPSLLIIASGGKSNVLGPDTHVTTAQVLRLELEALGVPWGNIIEEDESFTTLEQIPNCADILDSLPGEFGLLSMGWHLNRLEAALCHQNTDEKTFRSGSVFLSAERLLINDDPNWVSYFRELDATPEMQARRVGESLGIEQVITGYNSKYGQKPYKGFNDPLID